MCVIEKLSVVAQLFKNLSSSLRSVPLYCFLLRAFLAFYRVFDLYMLCYSASCVRGSIKYLALCPKSCWAWQKVIFVSQQAAFPSLCEQSENEVLVCKSSNLHAHVLFNFTASWVALIASRHLGPLLFKSNRRFWRSGTLWSLVFFAVPPVGGLLCHNRSKNN